MFQNEQNFVYIQKMLEKLQKMFSVFEIGAFEPVGIISPIYEKKTCDLH